MAALRWFAGREEIEGGRSGPIRVLRPESLNYSNSRSVTKSIKEIVGEEDKCEGM